MSDDRIPQHLRALLTADDGTLRNEIEKTLDRSVEKIATGRVGRAFKLGKIAMNGGARLALGRAKQLFGGEGPALSKDDGLALAKQMLETFSELRGVTMKLGQMLSYVDDSLPPEARKILALLQRDAPALPIETVRQVLTEELGRDPSTVFATFEERPLAAASIGQVHRATLLDGTAVAVKVQYPGIEQAMRSDLKNAKVGNLLQRALFVHTDIPAIMDELEQRLLDECDYTKEASYQEAFAERFRGHPGIVVPHVHREVSTKRVLVTTLQKGRTFYEWLASNPSQAERERVSRLFYRFYLGSFYIDGYFNCDPHPGNYLFTDDGKVVFLDYGCCRRFPEERRLAWVEMAQVVRGDQPAELNRIGLKLGFLIDGVEYDRTAFRSLMRYLYEPYLEDAAYDFTRHKPMKTFRAMFTENANVFKLNMPSDAVFLNRITFGLVSLLTEIGAPLNCYRLADQYFARVDPDWPEDPVLLVPRAVGA